MIRRVHAERRLPGRTARMLRGSRQVVIHDAGTGQAPSLSRQFGLDEDQAENPPRPVADAGPRRAQRPSPRLAAVPHRQTRSTFGDPRRTQILATGQPGAGGHAPSSIPTPTLRARRSMVISQRLRPIRRLHRHSSSSAPTAPTCTPSDGRDSARPSRRDQAVVNLGHQPFREVRRTSARHRWTHASGTRAVTSDASGSWFEEPPSGLSPDLTRAGLARVFWLVQKQRRRGGRGGHQARPARATGAAATSSPIRQGAIHTAGQYGRPSASRRARPSTTPAWCPTS